ncbi:MAG: hypothetical protein ACRDNT_02655 [Streptosporangiaceae bacterium]
MRQRNLVVWSSSAGPAGRHGVPAFTRPPRTTGIRRPIRTGALYAVIGLFRLARAVRARRHGRLLLAGAVLTAAGIVLPSGMAVIAGTLILLRGVAVALGVSDPRRCLDAAPGRADFFGFGTRPYPGSPGQNRT